MWNQSPFGVGAEWLLEPHSPRALESCLSWLDESQASRGFQAGAEMGKRAKQIEPQLVQAEA